MSLTEGMITPEQKKKIHTLLSKHNIKDSEYRILLENKYQVSSSVYLDEEQASELIEYLIEVRGDTYDRDNNTEYYQRKQAEKREKEKKEQDEFFDDLENYIDKKIILVKETIHRFAEGYSKTELIDIFLQYTTNEENIEILKKLIK